MGKQKPKRLAGNDTEQIVSRERLSRSAHSSEKKLSTTRTIINSYDDNLRRCREERQGSRDNRSRRETTEGSRKRSKSLTSMGRRKTDKKSYEVKSTKSTEVNKAITHHNSLRRSSLSEKKRDFELPLKPILKRDGESSAIGKCRSHKELATEGRKVSLVTTGSNFNGHTKQERDSLSLPRSSKSRNKQSLVARIEVDKAEARQLAERMAYNRAALVGNTSGSMSSSSDILNVESGASGVEMVSGQLVQLDENGNAGDKPCNYHTGNQFSRQSFNTAAGTEQKQTLEIGTRLSLTSPKSLHSDYGEIWIGRLPEPPTTHNIDLLGLSSTNFASFSDTEPLSPEKPDESILTNCNSSHTARDLIDFSIDFPSQPHLGANSGILRDLPSYTMPLISINARNASDTTLNASSGQDDALISRLLDKTDSSIDSVVFTDGEERVLPTSSSARSDNSFSMLSVSPVQLKFETMPKYALSKSYQLTKDCDYLDKNAILLNTSKFQQDTSCSKNEAKSNPVEVVAVTSSISDDEEIFDSDATSENHPKGMCVVPPPSTFGNMPGASDNVTGVAVGDESGLSCTLAGGTDTCLNVLTAESSDSHLIGISATDGELSSIPSSHSSSQLSASYQALADSLPAFSCPVVSGVNSTSQDQFNQLKHFSLRPTEEINSSSTLGLTENIEKTAGVTLIQRKHSEDTRKGLRHFSSVRVVNPKVLDTCPPLRKSFSSTRVKDSASSSIQSKPPLEVLPVVEVRVSHDSELKVDYSSLPRLALPQRQPKPRSHSLDLEIDVDTPSTPSSNDAEDCMNETQSLSGLNSETKSQSRPSRSDSFNERFSIPFRISKMFSKKKKSSTISADNIPSGNKTVTTVDSLYSDWLAEEGKNIAPKRRGEGVRTVVLARTKKGYGFVLRGAKAEQLKKLDVQFVPSEKMPALQYLDSVEKGSVSDKAGLRAGDFILEIDGVNVVHASHEQTVQVIKKAGDVLAMKVVRAVVTHENGGSHLSNGLMNGSATLPHRKIQKEEAQQGSSSAVLNRKSIPDTPNGTSKDDEKSAIEQLDAALANYDSDSRSSGSGANQTNSSPVKVTMREQKTASIRQRPSSSHFNSIQELDDMFAAPAPLPPAQPASDKAESRKPAKSRVKKFWSKGKGSGKLSDNKQLSLSQPNLAALDRDAEVKPITMYEMSLGHSVDDEGRALQADIPRTMSGDLSTLQRKSNNTGASSAVTSMLPPPPNFPAPTAPDDDKTSTASGSSNPGSHSAYYKPLPNPPESKRFLPRTPLPTDNTDTINSSHEASLPAGFGTFQRGKTPPPPPQRMSSHDYAIITVPGTAVRSVGENKTTTFESPKQTSTSVTPPANDAVVSSPFSEAIRKAAAERETDRSANNNTAESTNDIYAAVQKRQARLASADTNSHVTTTSSAPKAGGGVSVEDQLKMAVAKRRTVIERQDTTDSDRSSSHTPERTLAPNKSSGLTKSESTNFRELAEQKRQQFLKKKADSKDQLLPPPSAASSTPKLSDSSTEESLSELQKIMSRLSVAKADEPNNNTKKKIPPPVAQKKPEKPTSPTLLQDHLSPVEEFPPPPPPHDFGSDASDVIIPPPSFEISSQFDSLTPPPPLSPPSHSSYSNKSEPVHHHDADNHSVTSSAGSDTISSVSQDGNRFSVATSGYGSDPNRTAKFSFSGKNVEVWTGEEVGEWLESIGLGEYKTVFAENCIEGETLVSMTKADIKELGVEKVGHRVKLDKEIKKILPESNS